MIGSLKNAINTRLNANATIATYPIYFAEVPRSENLNTTSGYLRWTATFGDTIPEHGNDLESSEVIISIFAKNLATVSTLHKEVIRQMDDAPLSISNFIHCQRAGGGHLPPERELDTRLWHQVLIYEVLYD